MNTHDHPAILRILAATDGSAPAEVAIECAAWLAARTKAQLTVLYVIDARRLVGHFIKHFSEVLKSDQSEPFATRVRNYYQTHGEEALRRAVTLCQRHEVTCKTELQTGNVVKLLGEAALDFDLLMLGRHGEHEEDETGFLGSVAEKILRSVDGPVLLAHKQFTEFRRALLAYDGGWPARRAMHALAPLAVTLKMEVDAVELVGEGDPTTALSEVIHYFKDFPVHLSTHYLVGNSHSLILDHVRETGSDLLVMGAYDDSIGESLALGSTTDYLIHNSPVPTLVHH